jgi:polyhydroxyalkanoate synthesis regulator phasin
MEGDIMAKSIEDGFKDIFLAGVGALAITGEKAKEVVDTLIEKGSITVEQGKDINQELQHKATQTISKVREEAVAQTLKTMTPEEREEFAATVARLVAESKVVSEAEVVNDSDESDSKEEGSKEE